MLESFLSGYASGFVMSLMLGTVFFALIQHSVDYGFLTGLYIAGGVVLSDIIFISLAVFGAQSLPQVQAYESAIRLIGAILLLLLGLSAWWQKKASVSYPETRMGNVLYFIGKGFLLNALNPVNFFAWVSVSTYINGALHYTVAQNISYFSACLLAIFMTEGAIAFGAAKLRNIITERFILYINRLAGTVFIVAALYLLKPFVQ